MINRAIELGQQKGMDALGPVQRFVFMISEAEVYCDMEGIDGLIDRYGVPAMRSFAEAFLSIGATKIAHALSDIALSKQPPPQALLSLANTMITERNGYSYESIRAFVTRGTNI